MCKYFGISALDPFQLNLLIVVLSKVRQSSMIAIQIFDHRRFRRRDQGANFYYISHEPTYLYLSPGFLGVYNISAADALDLALTQPGNPGWDRLSKRKNY